MDDAAPAEPTDTPEQSFSTATLWLLTLGGGLLAALLIRLRQGVDPDLWLHLRLGEQLRAGERFQRLPDPLVVLADQPYSPTQWLAEVVMSVVHDVTGVAGIHVLRALAVVALLALPAAHGRRVHDTGARRRRRPAGPRGDRRAVGRAPAAGRPGAPRGDDLAVVTGPSRCHGALARHPPDLGLGDAARLLGARGRHRGAVRAWRCSSRQPRRERAWARLVGVVVASVAVAGLTPLGPSLLLEPLAVGAAARGRVNEWAAPGLDQPARPRRGPDGAGRARCARCATCGPASRSCSSRPPASPWPPRRCARSRSAPCWWCRPWRPPSPARCRSGPRAERLSPWPLVVTGALLLVAPGVVLGAPSSGPLPRLGRRRRGAAARRAPSSPSSRPPRAGCSGTTRTCDRCGTCAPRSTPPRWPRPTSRSTGPSRAGRPTPRRTTSTALVLVDGSALDRAVRSDAGWRQVAREGHHVVWERTA